MRIEPLNWLAVVLESVFRDSEHALERSLYDGSEYFGDWNFRSQRMDCGTDPAGLYEDDL